MPVYKTTLKAKRNFSKLRDVDLFQRGVLVYSGLSGNFSRFRRPTVSLDEFKARLDHFQDLMTDASFRDVRAVAQKNSVREEIVRDLDQFAFYVESVAGDLDQEDLFISSGFELASNSYKGPKALDTPKVKKLTHGLSGELLAKITNVGRQATHYEIRHGVHGTDPESWPVTVAPFVSKPISFTGLTPGKLYAFQARAFGRLGFTDWSQSITLMCI